MDMLLRGSTSKLNSLTSVCERYVEDRIEVKQIMFTLIKSPEK